jgi:hypothetical protein
MGRITYGLLHSFRLWLFVVDAISARAGFPLDVSARNNGCGGRYPPDAMQQSCEIAALKKVRNVGIPAISESQIWSVDGAIADRRATWQVYEFDKVGVGCASVRKAP